MSSNFQIQMGWSLDSTPITGSDPDKNLYPLQNALVNMGTGGTAEWFTQLREDDTLEFYFYNLDNLTGGPPISGGFSQLDARLSFTDNRTGARLWPFEEPESQVTTQLVNLGDRTSEVYSVRGQVYLTYQFQTIVEGVVQPLALTPGICELSVLLSLINTKTGAPMNFVFDPEMIVEAKGGGGSGGGGSSAED
ncbi:MAG: hypothetical protein AAGN66_19565 [Acidobacteriota bacterium]